ncbi:MAG: D-amino-acid transaminase [Pseudomonadota bacterium]
MSLPHTIYINGQYLDGADALVSVMDRAFLFGDGIYEVIAVCQNTLVDEDGHLQRLDRSLAQVQIDLGTRRKALGFLLRQVVRRNRIIDGLVYLQVTRGTAARDFHFPPNTVANLMIAAWAKQLPPPSGKTGIKVITVDEIRWQRRDIKSTSMLAQVLAKQKAAEHNVGEAWQVDTDGTITEGASSNAWIIKDGTLITRPANHQILKGITRMSVRAIIENHQIPLVERSFTREEARAADEAFITGAGAFITPVTHIDDTPIGTGKPGPLTAKLRDAYIDSFSAHA